MFGDDDFNSAALLASQNDHRSSLYKTDTNYIAVQQSASDMSGGSTWWFMMARRHMMQTWTSSVASPKFARDPDGFMRDRRPLVAERDSDDLRDDTLPFHVVSVAPPGGAFSSTCWSSMSCLNKRGKKRALMAENSRVYQENTL